MIDPTPLTPLTGPWAWLDHHVPLWVLIIAALTRPIAWSRYMKNVIEGRMGVSLDTGEQINQDSDDSKPADDGAEPAKGVRYQR